MNTFDPRHHKSDSPTHVASALVTSPRPETSVSYISGWTRLLVLFGLLLCPCIWSQTPDTLKPPVTAPDVEQIPDQAAAAVPAQMVKMVELGTKFDKLDGLCNTWNIGCPTAGDTIDRDYGGFRTALAKAHIGIINFSPTIFGYNFAQPPQNPQVYNFEKPNWFHSNTQYATYNIPSQNIQVIVGGIFSRTNNAGIGGPPTFRPENAYIYQKLLNGKLSYMLGYTTNDTTVYGGYIAGNLATGTLGVNAVIPYELGMSFTPFPAPAFSVKYTTKSGFYAVGVVQRSNDPGGTLAGKKRDRLGFRFDPHGDEALYIPEIGFKRASAANAKEVWFRATGFYNQTGFTDYKSLQTATSGPKQHNGAASAVFEQQLTQPDRALPYRGLYWTATAQYALPNLNIYQQYYQVALYSIGLARKRPLDVMILNLNRTQFSRTVLNTFQKLPLSSQTGVSTFDDSTTVSGTYGLHLAPGVVLSTLFSYTKHPSYAPRLANPVNGVVSLVFFY